jgi:hypothetical protein
MMKKISAVMISSLGLVALASGCAVDAVESEDLGTEEQGAVVCENDQATNSIIAGMAVVMAREVGRWQPKTDLALVPNDWTGRIQLTSAAIARCNDRKNRGVAGANANCSDMQNLLSLQSGSAGLQFGGVTMSDPEILRLRLLSYWDRQRNCDYDPNGDQGRADQCPAENHELTMYRATTTGSTCAGGKDFWYKATYAAGHPKAGQPLSATDAAQLRNRLKWAGEAPGTGTNPYLQFELDPNVAGDIKIDPNDNTVGGSSGSTGVCEAAANPVWVNNAWKCDTTNVAKTIGSCCSCNGEQRNWKAAIRSGFYACSY